MRFKLPNNKILIGINLLLIIIVFVLLIVKVPRNKNTTIISHDNNNSFSLTNPILDCEVNNINDDSFIFSKDINEKVEELKNKNSLDYISIYFRDLNNGPWVGVNEKATFAPASLLKVPIFIALLKDAEHDPSILDKKVVISPEDVNKEFYSDISFNDNLVVGQEYSLLDVAKHMVQKSDNTGVSVLLKNINKDNLSDVFKSIGVPYKDIYTEVSVNVKDYAGFFRVLFNSSYLSREMSEKALSILSQTEYNAGIVAGVPKGTIVAHKFGERNILGEENSTQLHDCGIVYYPSRPYIICIMTRGNSFSTQEKTIEDLSSFIYSQVEKDHVSY